MLKRILYGMVLAVLFVVVPVFLNGNVKAQTLVRVLAYPFPPFMNEDMKTGLTVDLVSLLNESQSEYIFNLHIQSPKRRYIGISSGLYDMVLFEMPQWGWKDRDLEYSTTREIMKGGEVYITANTTHRDQSFFQDLKKKRTAAYFGYHYGFAGFKADRKWLQKNFQIGLHNSHKRIVELVRSKKVDVGVVTYSFLQQCLAESPGLKNDLIVSEKWDQKYSLPALIGAKSTISVSEFESLLDRLKEAGLLEALFREKGLLEQLTY